MKLQPGVASPKFNLKDKDGVSHKLESVKSPFTVVYFYPKDDTPGCTIEAKNFSDTLPKFKALGASVIGVSGGDSKTKAKFCGRHNLKVTLVSDSDFSIAKRFGAYGKKSFMGKSFVGILRKTFVLDANKRVLKVFDTVKPEGHAKEVLSFIERSGAAAGSTSKKSVGSRKRSTSTGRASASAAPVKAARSTVAGKKASPSPKAAGAKKTSPVVNKAAVKKTAVKSAPKKKVVKKSVATKSAAKQQKKSKPSAKARSVRK